MSTLTHPPALRTVADLLKRLGDIPAHRIWLDPRPGAASEADVLEARRREGRLCELLDGVLVEKPMGLRESILAGALIALLRAFVIPRNLGIVSGEAGLIRLFSGLVRIPDVAFASWDRVPGRRVPTEPIPDLVPDLAVEVLSESNTLEEMARKRREYFDAGVRLAWMIDPDARAVAVYTSPNEAALLDENQTLGGGEVLVGFTLPLQELFAELDRRA